MREGSVQHVALEGLQRKQEDGPTIDAVPGKSDKGPSEKSSVVLPPRHQAPDMDCDDYEPRSEGEDSFDDPEYKRESSPESSAEAAIRNKRMGNRKENEYAALRRQGRTRDSSEEFTRCLKIKTHHHRRTSLPPRFPHECAPRTHDNQSTQQRHDYVEMED